MVTGAWDTSTLTGLWNPETGKVCVTCCGAGIPCSPCTDLGLTTPEEITITYSGLVNNTGCQVPNDPVGTCCEAGALSYKYTRTIVGTGIFDLASILNDSAIALTQVSGCIWQTDLPIDSAYAFIYGDSGCNAEDLNCTREVDSVQIQVKRGPSIVPPATGASTVLANIATRYVVGGETPTCDWVRMVRDSDSATCVASNEAFTLRDVSGPVDASAASFVINELI